MSGPISLTSVSKKKSLKGFMRTIRVKLDHELQQKLSWNDGHFAQVPHVLHDICTKRNNNTTHFTYKLFIISEINQKDPNSQHNVDLFRTKDIRRPQRLRQNPPCTGARR